MNKQYEQVIKPDAAFETMLERNIEEGWEHYLKLHPELIENDSDGKG